MSGDFEQAKSRVCQSEGAYVSVRPLASSWEQRKLGELYSLVSEKNDLTVWQRVNNLCGEHVFQCEC